MLVGELRDLETVAIAIETAETGHLVFGTLHTTTAASTVDRVIDQFPADRQAQIRIMLSESLQGRHRADAVPEDRRRPRRGARSADRDRRRQQPDSRRQDVPDSVDDAGRQGRRHGQPERRADGAGDEEARRAGRGLLESGRQARVRGAAQARRHRASSPKAREQPLPRRSGAASGLPGRTARATATPAPGGTSTRRSPTPRSIVKPAASTGASGANDAAKNPPSSGGSEFASAWMLEPMPRISPCTCGAHRSAQQPAHVRQRQAVERRADGRDRQQPERRRRQQIREHHAATRRAASLFSTCGSENFAATRRVVTICVKMAQRPTHAKKLPMRASLKPNRWIRNSAEERDEEPEAGVEEERRQEDRPQLGHRVGARDVRRRPLEDLHR